MTESNIRAHRENQELTIFSRWEKETRYYQIHLQMDLFGWVVIKRWGGINKATGQQRTLTFDNYKNALLAYEQVKKMRGQRGYVLTR